jgi:hypothetical protein
MGEASFASKDCGGHVRVEDGVRRSIGGADPPLSRPRLGETAPTWAVKRRAGRRPSMIGARAFVSANALSRPQKPGAAPMARTARPHPWRDGQAASFRPNRNRRRRIDRRSLDRALGHLDAAVHVQFAEIQFRFEQRKRMACPVCKGQFSSGSGLVQPQTRQGRGIAAAPQTPSSSGFRSDAYRHRQAEIQRGGASRDWLLGFARSRTARQQPRGEFASAGSTTRTKDARLQISQICSALRFGRCGCLQHVQPIDLPSLPLFARTLCRRPYEK